MPSDPTQQALTEQQEWLRVTLSSIGDGVITTDTTGNITFLNPVAQSLTGWTLEEASGLPLETVFQIVNEETRATVENPATRALREGLVVGLANHTLLIARDDTERPIDDSAAPIRNARGEVAGVVLVFRDVTERRRAEQALRHSEERFRLLVEGTRDYAIFMLDSRGNVVSWNPGAQRIKGYRADELIGKHFSCFYPPEAVAAGWPDQELERAARDGRFEDEGWRIRKDGSKFWANVILTALRDEAGRLLGFSKITRDLSERRQADALLQESERRYRRLFETAKDGILLIDAATGTISDTNPSLCQLLGYSHEEMCGKEPWQVGLFPDAQASRAAFQLLLERGYLRYDHHPLQTRGGQAVEVEWVSHVYSVDGTQFVQCSLRDVTERRQLERARVLAEASADLHRRKDEFLAMLSHELRNPLAPIVNAVNLLRLQQGVENPVQQQARAIIERQVAQLSTLVNDLLEVSRITTGRIRLNREQVDVRGVVERAVDTVRPLVEQRRHDLTLALPPGPAWVHVDPTRIEQVMVNLLNNAAKYTDEGGRIWVSVRQEGADVVLRVRDTGVGIAPNLLPWVFDLFTQAERSLDRSQGGLGIGLTLVQRLVEMHGGKVEASSALGQGSEFIVRLPVLPSPAGQVPPLAATTQPARRLRLLVVDDNVDAADSTALLLRMSGHEVQVAYTSPAALDEAARFQPDGVLLDIGLPDMDGYEVARRLRQDSHCKDVCLIAVTGYGQDADRHCSHAAGFDHHLIKPVDPQKLRDVLAGLASQRRQ
jgi:PAS domain S-box-containing protein